MLFLCVCVCYWLFRFVCCFFFSAVSQSESIYVTHHKMMKKIKKNIFFFNVRHVFFFFFYLIFFVITTHRCQVYSLDSGGKLKASSTITTAKRRDNVCGQRSLLAYRGQQSTTWMSSSSVKLHHTHCCYYTACLFCSVCLFFFFTVIGSSITHTHVRRNRGGGGELAFWKSVTEMMWRNLPFPGSAYLLVSARSPCWGWRNRTYELCHWSFARSPTCWSARPSLTLSNRKTKPKTPRF